MRRTRLTVWCAAMVLVWVGVVGAQETPAAPAETVRHLAGTVYEIQLLDGAINLLASLGDDGTLLVDTGYAATADGVTEALRSLDAGPVRVIVNTHGDPDHVGGNPAVGGGALAIAHVEAWRQAGTYFALPAVTADGPAAIKITAPTTLEFNGERVDLLPVPGGHTAGDLVVHFTRSGVAAVGDIVLTGTFPDADPGRGGDAQRLVGILQDLGRQLPAATILVPGHGDTLRVDELDGYIAMIEGSIAAVRAAKAAAESFDEMLAHNPLQPWAAWERPDLGLSFADWGGQIWASLGGGGRRPSICAPVTEALVSDGLEAAVATYRRLAATEPDRWNLSEDQLNVLGYQLLQRDMTAEAIAVLELNVAAYPQASNPYDSLGEAYMVAGDRDRAIANYRRSLELNPDNTNAAAMLARLGAE